MRQRIGDNVLFAVFRNRVFLGGIDFKELDIYKDIQITKIFLK
jgi:hypothetical protein